MKNYQQFVCEKLKKVKRNFHGQKKAGTEFRLNLLLFRFRYSLHHKH